MNVALTIFAHQAGHDILDLGGGPVDIFLPVGFVLNLSLLPSTSLFRLEFALVVINS